MKVPNLRDFLVHAEPLNSAVAFDNPELLRGGYVVGLNSRIYVRFIPDMSEVAPPWLTYKFEKDIPIETRSAALVWALRVSDYSVTSNSKLAGTTEKIPLLPYEFTKPDADPDLGVVWYVDTAEWSALTVELENLCERTSPFGSFVSLSELTGTHLWRFLTANFLASDMLTSSTVETLRQAR
ncbi:hypothetical protein [Nocardia sp. NPDC020380]|uniref:hypothetical protein n=1 Tax=Nocardia sp. NPDC020380 TaxID=3364309 RepID=UPI0037A8C2B9